jgi:carbon monoxide dehydrogenase subunit G
MRLTSELTVDAPLERAWAAVLELGGPVRVELGAEYEGTARLDDADEDEHAAGFYAQARETAGHGLAAAMIAARLSEEDGGTRIAVDTDLRLTGEARPGQDALQAAADDLLERVAAYLKRRLEQSVPQLPAPERPLDNGEGERSVADLTRELLDAELKGSDPSQAPELTRSEPAALEGSHPSVASVAGRVAERALLMVAGVALGLALGRGLWGRR